MKLPLYIALLFSLLSCQPHENSKQAESPNPAAPVADTTAAAPALPAPPDSAYLIVPGGSIGRINLGMPATELQDIMGKADSGDAAMGKSLQFWLSKDTQKPRQYVAIYTVNDFDGSGSPPEVRQVQVTSPDFRTGSGVGPGSTLAAIREQFRQLEPLAYYTNEAGRQVYIYDAQAQGIAFEVTVPDSISTAVTIHTKGADVTDTYLPIHPDMTRLRRP